MFFKVATKKRGTTMRDASSVLPFILPNSDGRKFHFHISRVLCVFGEPNDARIASSCTHHCLISADISFTLWSLTLTGQGSTCVP